MSDTPRTDAFYYDMRGEVPVLRDHSILEQITFARELERQRDELLAALLRCREEFFWHRNTGKKLSQEWYGELVDMIDAAIKKARGE